MSRKNTRKRKVAVFPHHLNINLFKHKIEQSTRIFFYLNFKGIRFQRKQLNFITMSININFSSKKLLVMTDSLRYNDGVFGCFRKYRSGFFFFSYLRKYILQLIIENTNSTALTISFKNPVSMVILFQLFSFTRNIAR